MSTSPFDFDNFDFLNEEDNPFYADLKRARNPFSGLRDVNVEDRPRNLDALTPPQRFGPADLSLHPVERQEEQLPVQPDLSEIRDVPTLLHAGMDPIGTAYGPDAYKGIAEEYAKNLGSGSLLPSELGTIAKAGLEKALPVATSPLTAAFSVPGVAGSALGKIASGLFGAQAAESGGAEIGQALSRLDQGDNYSDPEFLRHVVGGGIDIVGAGLGLSHAGGGIATKLHDVGIPDVNIKVSRPPIEHPFDVPETALTLEEHLMKSGIDPRDVNQNILDYGGTERRQIPREVLDPVKINQEALQLSTPESAAGIRDISAKVEPPKADLANELPNVYLEDFFKGTPSEQRGAIGDIGPLNAFEDSQAKKYGPEWRQKQSPAESEFHQKLLTGQGSFEQGPSASATNEPVYSTEEGSLPVGEEGPRENVDRVVKRPDGSEIRFQTLNNDTIRVTRTGPEGNVLSVKEGPDFDNLAEIDHFADLKSKIQDQLKEQFGSGKKPPRIPSEEMPSEELPEGPKKRNPFGDEVANFLDKLSGGLKSSVMSTGIPKTGISPHGFSTLGRSFATASYTTPADNPISASLKTAKYMIKPSEAANFLDANKLDMERFNSIQKNFSETEYPEPEGVFAKGHYSLFAEPLFRKIIPALKIEKAQMQEKYYLSQGMDPDKAARKAVDDASVAFGGLHNWNQSRFNRIALFAPDWLETNKRLLGGTVNLLKDPTSPEGRLYRSFLLNSILAYGLKNAVQYGISGQSTFENTLGHKEDIDIGKERKKDIYARPEGTSMDAYRIPLEAAEAIGKVIETGDSKYLTQIQRIVENRLSPLKFFLHLVLNRDFKGDPLYGSDEYGRSIPIASDRYTSTGNQIPSTATRIGKELEGVIPQPITATMKFLDSEMGPIEAGSKIAGLPVSASSYKIEEDRGKQKPIPLSNVGKRKKKSQFAF